MGSIGGTSIELQPLSFCLYMQSIPYEWNNMHPHAPDSRIPVLLSLAIDRVGFLSNALAWMACHE